MKLVDLLNIAKNIPLSSFDWGQDATMFLNRRLPDGSLVDISETGAQAYAKLIVLNSDKMLNLLAMDVTINGSRLIITDPIPNEPTIPPPAVVEPIPTMQVVGPVENVTVAVPAVPVNVRGPKWPLILACLLVAMLLSITILVTTDNTLEGQKENRNTTSNALMVIAEIIRAVSGNAENGEAYQPPPESEAVPDGTLIVDPNAQTPMEPVPETTETQ